MTDAHHKAACEALCDALGYRFRDATLLTNALTHRSFRNEHPELAPTDNERLEFLGDAVIDLVVAAVLGERFPDASEGELTRGRADLVSETGLTDAARRVPLGEALRLGKGEEKSGGRDKPRLLSSGLEAVVGAIYRDGGYQQAHNVVAALLEQGIDELVPGAGDFKSRAQEWAQATLGSAPVYDLISTEGPDHKRTFRVSLAVNGKLIAEGEGTSKATAEQAAARAALGALTR